MATKGTYPLNGKHAARISREKQVVHLGTFDDEQLAAEVYDAACYIFAKPISAYNSPYRQISKELFQKVLATLRDKGVLTNEDVIAISNRYDVLFGLAQKLERISGHGDSSQE
jgi:hypothetical protein